MKIQTLFAAIVTLAAFPALAQQSGQSSGSLINIHVSQTIPTVNYATKGSTSIDFLGTALMPRATGQAKIGNQKGSVQIHAEFKDLPEPTTFGSIYLVYVLWAITPEGRATNLGQLVYKDQKSKMDVTTKLQTFGMMVTVEPYFAVSNPGQQVVLANTIGANTKGTVAEVDANMELLTRGNYSDLNLTALSIDPSVPLDIYQAQNAIRIAKAEGADKYAPDAIAKAEQSLAQAQSYLAAKQKNSVSPVARQAVQAAEDARSISVRRRAQDKIAAQQLAAQQAKEKAQAEALNEAQQRAEAEKQKAAADVAAAKAAAASAEAEAATKVANAQAEAAKKAAANATQEKEALRARLLEQFNRVLPTTDTPRGLVLNMGDVLFNVGKADLLPPAQLALARLSGILSNYPSLHLSIEGYTDSTGAADFNQKLSEKRADSVQTYLVAQGIPTDSITATGLGAADPVADNSTSAGRQKNRRVEIVISGQVIGTKIGPSTPSTN
jgi:outer membrane protein OmpA-like peptidoglycan-associated protein